ncbi:MAG: hypothetical protein ABI458_00215 [Chloroflexota bacterium]
MSTSSLSRNDRLSAHRFRAPVALTGAALLGLSLLLSVGPALAANNHSNGNGANGNDGNGGANATNGTVKVHDAATGVETAGSGNEPHVCDFWLSFALDAPFEAGTWVVVSWAPTGDGSTVAPGVYDTTGDGIDISSIIDLPAGHYRVEWAAAGASVSSKKTFWVDADCDETVTPADEPPAEEPAPPAEEPAPPVEESVLSADGLPGEDSGTPSDEAPADGFAPLQVDPGTLFDDAPAEEPAPPAEDPGSPADESPATPGGPSDEVDSSQVMDPVSTDPGTSPPHDPLAGAAESGESTMSDTAAATLPVPSGIAATFGVLMLIVVHATARRGKRNDIRA